MMRRVTDSSGTSRDAGRPWWTVRTATPSDAANLADIYAPIVSTSAISFETVAPSPRDMMDRVASTSPPHHWLVCEARGGLVGYSCSAPLHPRPAYRWSAEVSVYVREDFRGRSIGSTLLDALIHSCRSSGLVNLFALIALPNDASEKLFERSAFRAVGVDEDVGYKLGRWHSVGRWQLKLSDGPTPPPLLD